VGKIREKEKIEAGGKVTGEEPFNYFMTLFYPVDSLKVYDYNRVLKDLNGLSSAEFMDKLSLNFDLNPLPEGKSTYPETKNKFCLLLDQKWHTMDLKPTSIDRSTPIS